MSFKQYIPDIESEWNDYWKKTSLEKELRLVETDGLQSIFTKFLPKTGKILDAGCGMGKWIVKLSKSGYNIQGIDNNTYAISQLKKYFPQAKVQPGDVIRLPYKDEEFAGYISLGVVEHFEEGPQQALKEAFRVLKKDGLAIVEVPFDSPLRIITRIFQKLIGAVKIPLRLFVEKLGLRKRRENLKTKFYEYHYTRKELREFMKTAGFKKIRIFAKDDISTGKCIALWLDYPCLQKKNGEIFDLNFSGIWLKRILKAISPFSYSALIVAVANK